MPPPEQTLCRNDSTFIVQESQQSLPHQSTSLFCTPLGAKFILMRRNLLKPILKISNKENFGGSSTCITCPDILNLKLYPSPLLPQQKIQILSQGARGIFARSGAFFRISVAWLATAFTVLTKYSYSSSRSTRQDLSKLFSHAEVIQADSLDSDPVL